MPKSIVKKGESRSTVRTKFVIIILLALFCLLVIVPTSFNAAITSFNEKTNLGIPLLPNKPFSLGLDLQGGAELIYQAEVGAIPVADQASAVEGVRDVIERRVSGGLGVTEPDVETSRVGTDYRIIVELPGITNVNEAIQMIGQTPILTFEEASTSTASPLTPAQETELNADNAAAHQKALTVIAAINNGEGFDQAVKQYSQDSTTTLAASGDLGFITNISQPEIYQWALTHAIGQVSSQPVTSSDGLNILKLLGSRPGAEEAALADLRLCYQGAQNCSSSTTKAQALAGITSLKTRITPQNFATFAKQYSADDATKNAGGDIGSFAKTDLPTAFVDPVWNAPAYSIVGPIDASDGYYLIYKKAVVTPKEFEVARVLIPLTTPADIVPPAAVWVPTGLSGKQLQQADVTEDPQTGEVEVSLQFNAAGTQLFSDITTRNVGKQIAIFLDGQLREAPVVNQPITNGSAVITGGFSFPQAQQLARDLNEGALPVPVQLLSQQTVDASLGADSLQKSFMAGLAGLLLVMIFMMFYYRLPGILAVVSLSVYTVLNLALFKLLSVTLTLSGIAGFILSIGMAVDANVLVFERLKEELRLGKTLRSALEESFLRAWPSIRDGHVTTLISCVVLTWFGTGFVQGFAVVLGIGTLVSLFSAITVTRTIMRLVFAWFPEKGSVLFLGYTKKQAAPSSK